jgi:nucleoside-diphosphate-sugar epimerase
MVYSAKKVLVTGASGFIGGHILPALLDAGYDIHAVSFKTRGTPLPGVTWHHCDLFNPSSVASLIQTNRPTHLLHLAWSMVPGGMAEPREHLRWLRASVELVRRFQSSGGRRMVVAGSCAEYDWQCGRCVEDVTPLTDESAYGMCKSTLGMICADYSSSLECGGAWARPFFVYGPGERVPRFVASIVSALIRRQHAHCLHGDKSRDFLHVADVASALVALLDSDVRATVNIGSGRPVQLTAIARYIARRLDATDLLLVGRGESEHDDSPVVYADVTRLTEQVGWLPSYDLERGLDDTIAWWQQQLKVEGVA